MRGLARDPRHRRAQPRQRPRREVVCSRGDVSVTRHVTRVLRAGVDHVEGDPVPDAGEAVPQELDEDGGDGELHVGHKQRHGDGARPPVLRVVNISIFNIAKIFLDFTSLRAMLTC